MAKYWQFRNRFLPVLFVVIFAVVGVKLLLGSHAATTLGSVCNPNPCTASYGKPYTINVDDGAGKTITLSFNINRPNNLVDSPSTPVPMVVMFQNNQNWGPVTVTGKFITLDLSTPTHVSSGPYGNQYADPSIATSSSSGYSTCGPSGTAQCDDLVGYKTLIQDLESCSTAHGLTAPCQNIDASRVYVSGGSKGGIMSMAMACDPRTSSLIAAAAPISAVLLSYNSGLGSSPNFSNQSTWPNCPSQTGYNFSAVDGYGVGPLPSNLVNHNTSFLWIYDDLDGVYNCPNPYPGQTACLSQGWPTPSGSWAWGNDQMSVQFIVPPRGCKTVPANSVIASGTVNNISGQVIQHDYMPCSASNVGLQTIEVTNGTHRPEGANADGVVFAPIIWNFFSQFGASQISPPPPAPSITLTASPASVSSGGSSTIAWNASNATSCTASGGWSGSKALSGSVSTGALSASQTYNLSCSGAGGSASKTADVAVTNTAPPPPAPSITLTASPASVSSGGSSTIAWNASNATSCTASGGWSGSKALSGSVSTGKLTALGNDNFILSCSGGGGTTTKSVTILITSLPPLTLSSTPGGSPPTVSATITLVSADAVGAKSVNYSIDGKKIANSTLDTTKLADGKHTITVTITKPDGKVVTEKKVINVNNHQGLIKNLFLKYHNAAAVSSLTGVFLLAIIVWFFLIRSPPMLAQRIVSHAENLVHLHTVPMGAAAANPVIKLSGQGKNPEATNVSSLTSPPNNNQPTPGTTIKPDKSY